MKKSMVVFASALVAGILAGAAPAALAQNFQDRTIFTQNEPFEVGDVRLEPGTYLIKVYRLYAGDRNTIQICSTDEKKIYATVASIPHPVAGKDAAENATFEWHPPLGNHSKALRSWVAMHATVGQDVVYSKSRAIEIARGAKIEVVAIPDETKVAELQTVPLVIETPTGEEKPYVAQPMPVTAVAEKTPEKPVEELPHTASSTPLLALLGAGLIGGAAFLHMKRLS